MLIYYYCSSIFINVTCHCNCQYVFIYLFQYKLYSSHRKKTPRAQDFATFTEISVPLVDKANSEADCGE